MIVIQHQNCLYLSLNCFDHVRSSNICNCLTLADMVDLFLLNIIKNFNKTMNISDKHYFFHSDELHTTAKFCNIQTSISM